MKVSKIKTKVFKLVCIVVTGIMVGYWILKFLNNEDTISIEYISVNEQEGNMLPEISICIEQPFLDEELQKIGHDLNGVKYLQYLKGDLGMNDTYKKINYNQVTLNLDSFFQKLGYKLEIRKKGAYRLY